MNRRKLTQFPHQNCSYRGVGELSIWITTGIKRNNWITSENNIYSCKKYQFHLIRINVHFSNRTFCVNFPDHLTFAVGTWRPKRAMNSSKGMCATGDVQLFPRNLICAVAPLHINYSSLCRVLCERSRACVLVSRLLKPFLSISIKTNQCDRINVDNLNVWDRMWIVEANISLFFFFVKRQTILIWHPTFKQHEFNAFLIPLVIANGWYAFSKQNSNSIPNKLFFLIQCFNWIWSKSTKKKQIFSL